MSEKIQKLTHRIAYEQLGEDQSEDFHNKMGLIQEYADQEVERYKQENIRNLLLDFADYNESDKVSTTTDEVVDNYLDEVKTNKR